MNNKKAIQANIKVHSKLAKIYNETEPHYNIESISRVEELIKSIITKSGSEKLLDLGCGTGFIIDIAKKYFKYINGVDITTEMTNRINMSGNAEIEIDICDTGQIAVKKDYFNLVTAYSFLDHLYDMKPTIENAFYSLQPGGAFYADLMPNKEYWNFLIENKDIHSNDILRSEIKKVTQKPEEIEENFNVSSEDFIEAEHQKHNNNGISPSEINDLLQSVGFKKVELIYHWFIGETNVISNKNAESFENAKKINNYLQQLLPISNNYFKYVGFIAWK